MKSLAVSALAGKDQSASNSRPGPSSPTTDKPVILPFAAVPHDLLADKRLTHADKVIAGNLLFWSKAGPDCWPGNKAIADRACVEPLSVPRSLARLESCGYVRRFRDMTLRSQRRIVLLWHPSAGATIASMGLTVGLAPPAGRLRVNRRVSPPLAPGLTEEESLQEEERSGSICDVENGRGGNPDATPDGATRDAWDALPEDVRRSLDQSAKPSDGASDALEAVAEPDRSAPTAGLADASEAVARLTPSSSPAAREQAARLIQAELGEADDAFMPAYRSIVSEVVKAEPGGLTPAAVAHALAEARKPRTRNRGKMFASTIGRCRAAGGMPPAPKLADQGQAKPLPIPAPYKRDAYRNKSSVFATARLAIERRAAEGMTPEANRATTSARASAEADKRGLDGAAKADVMEWVREALACVLDGAPLPNSAEYWRSAIGDIGRLPRRAAV